MMTYYSDQMLNWYNATVFGCTLSPSEHHNVDKRMQITCRVAVKIVIINHYTKLLITEADLRERITSEESLRGYQFAVLGLFSFLGVEVRRSIL